VQLVLNALRTSLLPAERKATLERRFSAEFAHLRDEHLDGQ
jgi:hypothetical protein